MNYGCDNFVYLWLLNNISWLMCCYMGIIQMVFEWKGVLQCCLRLQCVLKYYHSSTIIFTLICVLLRRNTSTEHQKLWFRHLHTILTHISSRVNETGSTHHCFVYISKQDGDIKSPKNCSDTSNPKQYFKTHCSLRQH
jgi:hypothetical protein